MKMNQIPGYDFKVLLIVLLWESATILVVFHNSIIHPWIKFKDRKPNHGPNAYRPNKFKTGKYYYFDNMKTNTNSGRVDQKTKTR